MKQYLVYKRIFSVFILFTLVFIPAVFLYAETAEELNKKIEEKNSDISRLEDEIASYQKELNTLGKQKNSLNTSLKELDLTKKKLQTDIALTQKKIEKTNLKIESLSSEIGIKGNMIAGNIEAIKIGLRDINEAEQESMVLKMLSRESFTSTWNDLDNIITLREKMRGNVVELEQVKGQLEDTRTVTMEAKKELVNLKNKLADQKKIIEQNVNEKKKLLAQTKNSEANYQKLLTDRLAKKVAFEKELEEYESQLKFILDPTLLPKSHVLSWPLDNIFITNYFSRYNANKTIYANGFHNGVDFRASVGTPVKAMADGTIAGVGDTDLTCSGASFGKFVFIKYNNGLASTYGHLSLIKVSTGQQVKRGDVVGYSGNTGYSTGPHLHVSIYAAQAVKMESRASKACGGRTYYMPIAPSDAYLDPMIYLPLYKK